MTPHGFKNPLTIALMLQSIVIFVGTLFTTGMLKFHGYPEADHVIWNPVSVVIRNWGWWAIVIPPLWLGVSLWRGVDRNSMTAAIFAAIGVLVLIGFYYWTASTAGTVWWSGAGAGRFQ